MNEAYQSQQKIANDLPRCMWNLAINHLGVMLRFHPGRFGYDPRPMLVCYGETENTARSDPNALKDLDPIVDEHGNNIAGQLKIELLMETVRKIHFQAVTNALSIIQEEPDWMKTVFPLAERGRSADVRYMRHMVQLLGFGVVRYAQPQKMRFWSGYFAVDKNADTSRSIFNGKRMSKKCPVPPSVNLATSLDLIRLFRRHIGNQREGRAVYVLAGDFRHWFHQIPVPVYLQQIFGIRMGHAHFAWNTLPMGWSFSPAIAQGCAWSILCARAPNEKSIMVDEGAFHGAQLPQFVNVLSGCGRTSGFMTVYYDNFIVVTDNASDLERIHQRIQRNCALYKCTVKAGSLIHLNPRQFIDAGLDHLGVHIQGIEGESRGNQRRAEEHRKPKVIGLQTYPAKAQTWTTSLGPQPKMNSLRDQAELLGRMIFGQMLNDRPLTSTPRGRTLIIWSKAIGRAGHRQDWGGPPTELIHSPLEHPRCSFLDAWTDTLKLMTNPHTITSNDRKRGEEEWLVASDASDTGYGVCVYRKLEGRWTRLHAPLEYAFVWNTGDAQKHIYLQEMMAAREGLRIVRGLMSDLKDRADNQEAAQLIVVQDNSAVAFALMNGLTSHLQGMEILMECDLTNTRVVQVISEDNPADCPSRMRTAGIEERERHMFIAAEAAKKGIRYASLARTNWWTNNDDPERGRMPKQEFSFGWEHETSSDEEESTPPVRFPVRVA